MPGSIRPLAGYLLALLLVSGAVVAQAERVTQTRDEAFLQRHQVGLRIGVWGNLGGTPLDEVWDSASSFVFINDFSDASFYLEALAALRFGRLLMGELSVGSVSRGEVTRRDQLTNLYGNLVVYPMLLKLRFYPLIAAVSGFYPYVTVGGGVYHARHDIEIASGAYYYDPFYGEESKTSVSYVLGAGLDWPIMSAAAVELNVQYMPIGFSDKLIGVKDWSSLTVTVGVKYLFKSRGK